MSAADPFAPLETPVPERFNIARYCLGPARHRRADKTAMIVATGAGPDAPCERWAYGDLREAVLRVGAGLRATGLTPGARVMIRMGNTSDYALMFFGALAAGLVPLPSSAMLTQDEALFLLADSEAAAIALGPEDPLMVPAGILALRPVEIAALKAYDPMEDFAPTQAGDPAYLVYTSGTSGRPKGVLHAHRAAWGRRPMYRGWYGMDSEDVVLHAGAFNWTYTLGVGLTDPWALGATAVLYNGPRDVKVWPRLIETHRATIFATVPGLYRQILKYAEPEAHDLSSLRHGLTAGEALMPDLLAEWRERTGTPLYEALGMSEISTYISSSPEVPIKPGSPGKPQPARRVAVLPVDPQAEHAETPLPPDQTGLLAVHRSDPALMLGYWKRPEEEAEVFRGDWFCGGDLAHQDTDGYIWYHGRADDVMTAQGYRVSPGEVESVLAAHEAVAEVAAADLTVGPGVRIIAAYVVPREGAEPGEALKTALLEHAAAHLARYKCPKEIVFLEALPRTANGKVRRKALSAAPE